MVEDCYIPGSDRVRVQAPLLQILCSTLCNYPAVLNCLHRPNCKIDCMLRNCVSNIVSACKLLKLKFCFNTTFPQIIPASANGVPPFTWHWRHELFLPIPALAESQLYQVSVYCTTTPRNTYYAQLEYAAPLFWRHEQDTHAF